jgi:hypothetical protein
MLFVTFFMYFCLDTICYFSLCTFALILFVTFLCSSVIMHIAFSLCTFALMQKYQKIKSKTLLSFILPMIVLSTKLTPLLSTDSNSVVNWCSPLLSCSSQGFALCFRRVNILPHYSRRNIPLRHCEQSEAIWNYVNQIAMLWDDWFPTSSSRNFGNAIYRKLSKTWYGDL